MYARRRVTGRAGAASSAGTATALLVAAGCDRALRCLPSLAFHDEALERAFWASPAGARHPACS
jgi:hypothetical protein